MTRAIHPVHDREQLSQPIDFSHLGVLFLLTRLRSAWGGTLSHRVLAQSSIHHSLDSADQEIERRRRITKDYGTYYQVFEIPAVITMCGDNALVVAQANTRTPFAGWRPPAAWDGRALTGWNFYTALWPEVSTGDAYRGWPRTGVRGGFIIGGISDDFYHYDAFPAREFPKYQPDEGPLNLYSSKGNHVGDDPEPGYVKYLYQKDTLEYDVTHLEKVLETLEDNLG